MSTALNRVAESRVLLQSALFPSLHQNALTYFFDEGRSGASSKKPYDPASDLTEVS